LILRSFTILERPSRLNIKSFTEEAIRHTKRPDLDNLQKGTQDALREFWVDDSLICSLHISKWYAPIGKPACIVVEMSKCQ
jgi:Holliday junction resolvase RusA-like endonuclease